MNAYLFNLVTISSITSISEFCYKMQLYAGFIFVLYGQRSYRKGKKKGLRNCIDCLFKGFYQACSVLLTTTSSPLSADFSTS